MATTYYQLVTGLLCVLLIWAAVLFYKNPSWAIAMLLPLLLWLIFDPLVLAVGNLLGEGALLQVLSRLRYLLRVLAMPFLIIVAFDQLRRAQLKWANDILIVLLVWVVVFALVGFGLAQTFWGGLGLEIVEIEDIKQYKEVEALGLPFAAIGTLTIITLIGLALFLKARTPWLLLGALLMLAILLAPASMLPSVTMAAASVLLVLGILLTEMKVKKISPNPRQ